MDKYSTERGSVSGRTEQRQSRGPHRARIATLIVSSAVAVLLCGVARAATEDTTPSNDACAAVATAKFKEWAQPRVMENETRVYGDGKTRTGALIVTANTAYETGDATMPGGIWITAQVTIPQRRVPSPEVIAKNMGLASCTLAGHVQEAGVAATMYTFTYLPENDGSVPEGAIWVSDATGLPLRQHFKENGELANRRVARTIDGTIVYDFVVPRAAERAQSSRLWEAHLMMNGLQGMFGSNSSGGAGAQ
jgi:hypothetical protein